MTKSDRRIRIISGEFGGQRISTPKGIRPTTERVREAIFSAQGDIGGVSVLDLYTGSGAFGLEAISRGSAKTVLVEHNRNVAATCRENLESIDKQGRGRLVVSEVLTFLSGSPPPEAPFDLVCCDPPYEIAATEIPLVLTNIAQPGWLTPDARVVIEQAVAREFGEVTFPKGWITASERKYGGTIAVTLKLA